MTISIRHLAIGIILILAFTAISGCDQQTNPTKLSGTPTNNPTNTNTATPPTQTVTVTSVPETPTTKPPVSSATPTATAIPEVIGLDPENWMDWPVLPIITQEMKGVYERGQSLGRNANAFSIFGDCQSTPEEFLGLYETDQEHYAGLPDYLQETAEYFEDSLSHDGPTVKSGTTTGALLWAEWHEGRYGCLPNETPVECEIRNNNPAFVIISVGTHYERRNAFYLRIIIEDLLARGIIPILSTKADNREGDHRINLQTAELAVEFNVPLWNFWAATSHLPDNGLVVQEGNEFLGQIYFNDEVKDIHRLTALQTLDKVRRTLEENN